MIELWADYFEPKLESRLGNCLNNCASRRFVHCVNTCFNVKNTHLRCLETLLGVGK